ncbi:Dbp7p [Cryptosporidium sp. chipmunk genotype I]|uniref:Dbp7p n=1 Tax=Cryptosporidium sp. chipmunk genotype I TaxID=1280935 RepID=UPI00351A1F87|nr:Dbp7p [Cryptosporidium sp. chipmunk genotype I]
MDENLLYFTDEELKEEEINDFSKPESIYNRKFSDVEGLNEKLVSQLSSLGYEKMTKVQEIVIPKILGGGDILLRAPTGTGKTLSFLVPAIQRSLLNEIGKTTIQRGDGTIILILTPTRELCIQTIETARLIVQKMSWCVTGCICGGEKRKSEKARLRKGITILGGTPGRILDHIDSTSCFKVTNLKTLIVDEADRLLEEGFGASYKKVYQFLMNKNANSSSGGLYSEDDDEELSMLLNVKVDKEKKFYIFNKQIILVSATLSKLVEDLARYSLKNNPEWLVLDQYREIGYKKSDGDLDIIQDILEGGQSIPSKGFFSVPINLRQEYVVVQDKFRIPALISLLLSRTGTGKRTVVFVSSTQVVEFYFALLQSMRWPSKLLIRGGPNVKSSIKLLENFKKEIDNRDLRSDSKSDITQSKFKSNKKKKYNGYDSDSDAGLDGEMILSGSDSEFESKRDKKRTDNNNFHKGHKKWFTNNTQLFEIFESMFDKYIFKNSIFDDEVEYEKFSNINYENKYLDDDGDIVSINEFVTQPPIFMLHGHMSKDDRLGQLSSFEKSKKGGVIITSDVASRGLNFPKIDTVIQLDPPQSIEEYVHRMGRTARMGEKGTGIIFLRPSEEGYLETLKSYNITGKNGIFKLSDTTIWEGLISNNNNSGKIDDISGFFYSIVNKIITLDPNDFQNELLNKARRAYIAFVRSYMSYDREFSRIFSIKKLHLGHVASSFGINEQPNKIIGHIKYLDGVISHKEKININKSISAKKNKSSSIENFKIVKRTNKQISKVKDTSIRKKSEKKSNFKNFNFKSDSSKSGIIDKALQLMKNKSEIHVQR